MTNFERLYLFIVETYTRFANCFRTVEHSTFQNRLGFSVIVPPFQDMRHFLSPVEVVLLLAQVLSSSTAALQQPRLAAPSRRRAAEAVKREIEEMLKSRIFKSTVKKSLFSTTMRSKLLWNQVVEAT